MREGSVMAVDAAARAMPSLIGAAEVELAAALAGRALPSAQGGIDGPRQASLRRAVRIRRWNAITPVPNSAG